MKPYTIVLLPTVDDDLVEIYRFIAPDNPSAALAAVSEIRRQIAGLVTFPERYPLIRHRKLTKQGYRKLVVGNYLVFFRIVENEIIVHRVLHGKRDYWRKLNNGDIVV